MLNLTAYSLACAVNFTSTVTVCSAPSAGQLWLLSAQRNSRPPSVAVPFCAPLLQFVVTRLSFQNPVRNPRRRTFPRPHFARQAREMHRLDRRRNHDGQKQQRGQHFRQRKGRRGSFIGRWYR